MSEKTQIGPRISEEVADAFEWLVRDRNDGIYKGRMSNEVERALELYMGSYVAANPDKMDEVDDEVKAQYEEYEEKFLQAQNRSALADSVATAEDINDLKQEVASINQKYEEMVRELLRTSDPQDQQI